MSKNLGKLSFDTVTHASTFCSMRTNLNLCQSFKKGYDIVYNHKAPRSVLIKTLTDFSKSELIYKTLPRTDITIDVTNLTIPDFIDIARGIGHDIMGTSRNFVNSIFEDNLSITLGNSMYDKRAKSVTVTGIANLLHMGLIDDAGFTKANDLVCHITLEEVINYPIYCVTRIIDLHIPTPRYNSQIIDTDLFDNMLIDVVALPHIHNSYCSEFLTLLKTFDGTRNIFGYELKKIMEDKLNIYH